MSAVIGVDYSSSGIYLGVSNSEEKVLNTGYLSLDFEGLAFEKRGTFMRLKNVLYELHNMYSCSDSVYIEQAWVNGSHFPKSGLMLARTSAWIEIASLEVGLIPLFIHPGTWRKAVFGNGRPPEAKEASVNFVKEKFSYDVPVFGKTGRGQIPDHNYADAICISHYGVILEANMNLRKISV